MYAARKSTPPPADEERISIPGVASRVVARVDRRTNRSVTLTRELPLLRIGTSIEGQGGRPGSIAGVWISMEGDVPALCVEVAYDDDRPSGRPPAVRGDSTIGYEAAIPVATATGSGKRPKKQREDDTNRHATLAYDPTVRAGRDTVPYEAERITRPAPAPVVIRLSLWDRLLDVIDAVADRCRAWLRSFARRPSLPRP